MEFSDIFKLHQKQPECKQGKMLIAQPFLQELYFNHSCICMVDYKENAPATGLVLNKKTNLYLDNLVDGLNTDAKIPVFCGGPVSMDRLFFIHDCPDIKRSSFVTDGLYFNGDFKDIIDYINSGCPVDGHLKFFVGYSGWEISQLPDEIANHVWAIAGGDAAYFLKNEVDDYWYDCVKRLGANYRAWLLCPANPVLN